MKLTNYKKHFNKAFFGGFKNKNNHGCYRVFSTEMGSWSILSPTSCCKHL